MTNRQKKLGVTKYGYEDGIIDGNFLIDIEAFLAKIAMVKKGEYRLRDLVKTWFPEFADYDSCIDDKHQQAQCYCLGLAAKMPEHISYTCTNDLDSLILK